MLLSIYFASQNKLYVEQQQKRLVPKHFQFSFLI
jgi:hypothetical protein